jgi:hypothetical protein
MTISQSRYGANSEIGRNPTRKTVKDQSAASVLGGAALAAGGYGVYGAGKGIAERASRRVSIANSAIRPLQEDRVVRAFPVKDLDSRMARRGNLGPTSAQTAQQVRNKIALLEAERKLKAARGLKRKLEGKMVSANKLGGKLRGAGVVAGLAGLGIAGASAYRNERARGTFGYKRPTLRDMRMNAEGM